MNLIIGRSILVALGMLHGGMFALLAADADPSEQSPAQSGPPLEIAATVNGEPIYVGEIDTTLDMMAKSRQPTTKSRAQTQAEVLRQIVNRRLAEIALRRDDAYVTQAQIDKAINTFVLSVKAQRQTMEQYVSKRGVTMDSLRHDMAWKLGWEKYLDRHLFEALENYFKEHHQNFDGTQLRVSHILLRPNRYGESNSQLVARAEKIREEIEAGKLTFEQAAEKYSAGPSRHQGGDLGLIPRYGVMVEEFAKPAFELEKGELSKPIVTPFGVHLIRVTDSKPGNRQWTEATEQMKNPASVDMFEALADQERDSAQVEFTGKVPYFKPGTEEIVMPVDEKQ